ncbi:MAG TPA: helix-turn-helix transcriptional regulator [Pseudomonadota bacterium]|nr:helix-turn-helix transcriptional regulator [Pseudomonadota bacterium]
MNNRWGFCFSGVGLQLQTSAQESLSSPSDSHRAPHAAAWKSVQKVVYGQTDPKASTLLKLCAAFDVTLPELLTFDSTTRELAKPDRADS